MSPSNQPHDVLIIGGGPSGATAALQLARAGISVLIVERSPFPRFHVGESFLPANLNLIRKLGLEPALREIPHTIKLGAEFAFGNVLETSRFSFDEGLDGSDNATFNIERAPFDKMLLDAAREAGADVLEGATVRKIVRLADGDVEIDVDGRSLTGKYLIDGSGQATVLGKHLGTRRGIAGHTKVAYFGHFDNVKRLDGREAGYPAVAMFDEGWFWMIPIDERRTSIGLVLEADLARNIEQPASQMLAWGIARCPLLRDRTANAVFPERNHVIADYTYTCAPYAGPGYFMVGDSAIFLDPIFSSGVCLGMVEAVEAAQHVVELLTGRSRPNAARRAYTRTVSIGSSVFFRLINLYYDHSFRELFLHGQGPLQIKPAVISLLAGHVFPKPAFAMRWRLRLFEWLIFVNRYVSLVPRRERFSLLAEPAVARQPTPGEPVEPVEMATARP